MFTGTILERTFDCQDQATTVFKQVDEYLAAY